jgi:hypothetical protein
VVWCVVCGVVWCGVVWCGVGVLRGAGVRVVLCDAAWVAWRLCALVWVG